MLLIYLSLPFPSLTKYSSLHILCSIILETTPNTIAGKVGSNSTDSGAPLSEQVCCFLPFDSIIFFKIKLTYLGITTVFPSFADTKSSIGLS